MNLFSIDTKKDALQKHDWAIKEIAEEISENDIHPIKQKYSVIYYEKKKRVIIKFVDKDEAQDFYNQKKQKSDRVAFIEIGVIHPKDDSIRHKGSDWWCPYCGTWRKFKHDKKRNLKVCFYCGISEADYYVKKYNNRWKVS